MNIKAEEIKISHLFQYKKKRKVLIKFVLILAILSAYFFWVSLKYGYQQGLAVTILTWSFFVFCTPIADAGFLIDFPLRIILKIKMVYIEMIVWIFATILNLYFFFLYPQIYNKTSLLIFFHYILAHPFPLWVIILISALGTFVSIKFGDELMDVVQYHDKEEWHRRKNKYKWLILIVLFILVIIIYKYVLNQMNISLNFFK